LVTGGAGFIGSHIVDGLIEEGHQVAVVDDLSTGRKENLNPDARFYELDIQSSELSRVFDEFSPEWVCHQAAQIDVRKSMRDPAFDARVNILGGINLLEEARKHQVEKIVYASSGGAVYGEPQHMPVDENHPINPECPYGASKHCLEKYLQLYHRMHGLKYVTLRYSNVYGPRQDPFGEAGVVAIFTGQYLKGETPRIYGDGEQTRDFVYVEDVVKANLKAFRYHGGERVFNIGSGKETSVNQIAQKLKELTGSDIQATHTDPVEGEVKHIYLDCTKAMKKLKWNKETDIHEGLAETVKYFKNKL